MPRSIIFVSALALTLSCKAYCFDDNEKEEASALNNVVINFSKQLYESGFLEFKATSEQPTPEAPLINLQAAPPPATGTPTPEPVPGNGIDQPPTRQPTGFSKVTVEVGAGKEIPHNETYQLDTGSKTLEYSECSPTRLSEQDLDQLYSGTPKHVRAQDKCLSKKTSIEFVHYSNAEGKLFVRAKTPYGPDGKVAVTEAYLTLALGVAPPIVVPPPLPLPPAVACNGSIPEPAAASTPPTEIYTEADLQGMQDNTHYILMADINDDDHSFTPLSSSGIVLNGNGRTITSNQPIFDNLAGSQITNLVRHGDVEIPATEGVALIANRTRWSPTCFDSISISGTARGCEDVGGLVGSVHIPIAVYNSNSSVHVTSNCGGESGFGSLIGEIWVQGGGSEIVDSYATGSVIIASGGHAGGIVGTIFANDGNGISNIRRVYATGNLQGHAKVGGLIGAIYGDGVINIDESFATGDIAYSGAAGQYMGGFIGWAETGTFTNSYALGNVDGIMSHIGGFVGLSSNRVSLTNVYSAGNVPQNGQPDIGGLTGDNLLTTTSSYWDIDASGFTTSGQGIGRTTNQMKDPGPDVSTYLGWDFTSVWKTCPQSYPTFQWRQCPDVVPSPPVFPPPTIWIGPITLNWLSIYRGNNSDTAYMNMTTNLPGCFQIRRGSPSGPVIWTQSGPCSTSTARRSYGGGGPESIFSEAIVPGQDYHACIGAVCSPAKRAITPDLDLVSATVIGSILRVVYINHSPFQGASININSSNTTACMNINDCILMPPPSPNHTPNLTPQTADIPMEDLKPSVIQGSQIYLQGQGTNNRGPFIIQ